MVQVKLRKQLSDKNMDINKFKENYKTKYLAEEYERLLTELEEAKSMLGIDPEMDKLAEADILAGEASTKELLLKMEAILEGDKEEEEKPKVLVLGVRAGVGGEEAAIFAQDLALMYERYAKKKNNLAWR